MARGVNNDDVAISNDTYEIMGRDVSLLLGDHDREGNSSWLSTAVFTYTFYILDQFLYCIFET
jgi:hypothetical protein